MQLSKVESFDNYDMIKENIFKKAYQYLKKNIQKSLKSHNMTLNASNVRKYEGGVRVDFINGAGRVVMSIINYSMNEKIVDNWNHFVDIYERKMKKENIKLIKEDNIDNPDDFIQMKSTHAEIEDVTLKEFVFQMDVAFSADNPANLFIWGAPGIGKSQLVEQYAKENKLTLIIIIASLMEKVDLLGVPSVINDRTRFNLTDIWPSDNGEHGYGGIIFFDELNRAAEDVLNACLTILTARKIGTNDNNIPLEWRFLAAGNRASDEKGYLNKLSTAMATRFSHFNLEPTAQEFLSWAKTSVSKSFVKTHDSKFIKSSQHANLAGMDILATEIRKMIANTKAIRNPKESYKLKDYPELQEFYKKSTISFSDLLNTANYHTSSISEIDSHLRNTLINKGVSEEDASTLMKERSVFATQMGGYSRINPDFQIFLGKYNEYFYRINKETFGYGGPGATPRTWEEASKTYMQVLYKLKDVHFDSVYDREKAYHNAIYKTLSSALGKTVASKFMNYYKLFKFIDMSNLHLVFSDPKKAPMPSKTYKDITGVEHQISQDVYYVIIHSIIGLKTDKNPITGAEIYNLMVYLEQYSNRELVSSILSYFTLKNLTQLQNIVETLHGEIGKNNQVQEAYAYDGTPVTKEAFHAKFKETSNNIKASSAKEHEDLVKAIEDVKKQRPKK